MADTIPPQTLQSQSIASDPAHSAWVSANAGSGKTFVLTLRVIRLLLDNVKPGQILCLTFTKAAAAEMSNRVFDLLGKWVGMHDTELAVELEQILARPAKPQELERARTLFALSLDTPGGLKIQTIHAFCEALLHQFPLEANVSGHFTVLDETGQQEIVAEARRDVLLQIEKGSAGQQLTDAFDTLLDSASDTSIEMAISELIARRDTFQEWAQGNIDAAMAPLHKSLRIDPEQDEARVLEEALAPSRLSAFTQNTVLTDIERTGGASNLRFAALLRELAASNEISNSFRIRTELFLTREGKPRKTLLTKAVMSLHPHLSDLLAEEATILLRARDRLNGLRMLRASRALFIVGDAILQRYQKLKRQNGLADFNDLIVAAANLLTRADIRNWVQYKLDSGIDHILIDEAQDTSPRQWEIIDAIVEEFFAGKGNEQEGRTVFAVGDEKQSIYSFQGADPRQFSVQARMLERKSREAGKLFHPVGLHLSFRSAPDILDAVDTVFDDPEIARGLSAGEEKPVHEALRGSDPGEVQLWPLIGKERAEETNSWFAPVDAPEADDPAIQLAQRIAATIAGWVKRKEKLPGRRTPVRCGDILILVRRRDRFATAVTRELKLAGLSIAGADRLRLTEHIAVEDLMAIGRFVLMPEDDLSLAAALKSPVFGFDDHDLIEIASSREGMPLFDHMKCLAERESVSIHEKLKTTIETLERLRVLSFRVRPHEFFAHILSGEAGRRAFLSRLGTEAEDVLDAFLQAALSHERAGGKTLEDFLSALSLSAPEIKREVDMRRDEIRVITVHAAKGLEAPIVFLVDPCTPAFNKRHRPQIVRTRLDEHEVGYLWQPDSKNGIGLTETRYDEIEADAEAEYRRLLYVGMTRAADRLIVCGWHGINSPTQDHWHAMVSRQLADNARNMTDENGEPYLSWQSPRADIRAAAQEKAQSKDDTGPDDRLLHLPDWLHEKADREPAIPRPLTPSDAGRLLRNNSTSVVETQAGGERQSALYRGTATHRLLQLLPDLAAAEREGAARKWLAKHARGLSAGSHEDILKETVCVLTDERLAALFGPGSRAEADVAGKIQLDGREIMVSGQIDRLVVTEGEIILADYKTNQDVPQKESLIPQSYLLQLALYRELLRKIYPSRKVRCWLIWTQNGQIDELGDAAMKHVLTAMQVPQPPEITLQ